MNQTVRRLIEVDLPIKIISEHARHDQKVKRGHLHTLHVWWATRPLAACRAVILATLLPDPADENCPEEFRKKAREAISWLNSKDLSNPLILRETLLDFIAHFSKWELSSNPKWVETARSLVKAAHTEGLPLILDPFAGIGSIPFEALRVGADAFASDLNPVAVLLLKTALEYLPTYGEKLAEAVQKWGDWVKEQAMKELRKYYPKDPDGNIPLAYLWARTIRCEGPGCGAEVPLVGLLWLSRKERQKVALRYIGDKGNKEVRFEIFNPKSDADLQSPIVKRFASTCPICGYTTPYKRVREQIKSKGGGTRDARMIAVVLLKPDGSRKFRLANEKDLKVALQASKVLDHLIKDHKEKLPLIPNEPTPESRGPGASRAFSLRKWNINTWGDLFTPRQSLALVTFSKIVKEAYNEIIKENNDKAFARAVITCLAIAISNMIQNITSQSQWLFNSGVVRSGLFGNALPMRPDFAEINPTSERFRGIDFFLKRVIDLLMRESLIIKKSASLQQGSATSIPLPDKSVKYVITDPPYYDSIPYSDLSDFFYIWLKRMIRDIHPDLFQWSLTPKAEECIMDPGPPRPGEPEKTKEFFEQTMQRALAECKRVLLPDGVSIVLFAHKDTSGWEALLNALNLSGWVVTSSWPIETEDPMRMRAKNSAVLASSVFLVCRPRPQDAGIGDWRKVLEELRLKVHEWLPRLAKEGIEGADAIFACIGPALEVFSKYDRVETASDIIPLTDIKNGNGKVIKKGFLSFLWETIAKEAMLTIAEKYMEGADPTGFEEDSRVTAMWLWALHSRDNNQIEKKGETFMEEEEEISDQKQLKGYSLPYDDARLIIQGLGAHEESLKRPGGILEVKGETARLVSVLERAEYLMGKKEVHSIPKRKGKKTQLDFLEELGLEKDEKEDKVIKPGSTVLDQLHQSMLLFAEGRSEALRRFLVEEGVGKNDRFWKLANALSALYPKNSQEKRWVDGIIGKRKTFRL